MKKIQNDNLENLTYLTNHQPFIDYVQEIRKELNIPTRGFYSKKECQTWHEAQRIKSDNTQNDKSLKIIEDKIRNDLNEKLIDRKMAQEQSKIIRDKRIPLNNFSNSINEIIKKFKLPINLYYPIMTYVLYGKFYMTPNDNYSFNIKDGKIDISIYSRMTKEQMSKMIKFIRKYNKDLPRVLKVPKNTDKNMTIASLYNNNYYNEEDSKINAKEKAKEYFGKKGKAQQVYDAKRTNQKNLKRRFE